MTDLRSSSRSERTARHSHCPRRPTSEGEQLIEGRSTQDVHVGKSPGRRDRLTLDGSGCLGHENRLPSSAPKGDLGEHEDRGRDHHSSGHHALDQVGGATGGDSHVVERVPQRNCQDAPTRVVVQPGEDRRGKRRMSRRRRSPRSVGGLLLQGLMEG